MKKYKLFWGDFHKHLSETRRADDIIEAAKCHLDVYAVLCYPFRWEKLKGARVETVRQREEFLEDWRILNMAAEKHNRDGDFVTFPGYEWHGNRTDFGDHNVIYFDGYGPLDDAWDIRELYSGLRRRKAFAIPHHTAYMPGNRGKRWEFFDSALSPVMEIYSGHGSSEGDPALAGLLSNESMGPDASGGSFIDALNRGCRVGVIASNDGKGLPGSWPNGVAGIWAEDLTRESIWEALSSRRTIAATGDRINLWFSVNGAPGGSVSEGGGDFEAAVNVETSQPLDRIELVHDGRTAGTYVHGDRRGDGRSKKRKILVEFGWGPAKRYGFGDAALRWKGFVRAEGGELLSVEPRFSGLGQGWQRSEGGRRCDFTLTTSRDSSEVPCRQGLILELKGSAKTRLIISVNGKRFEIVLGDTYGRIHLFPFPEESMKLIRSHFGIRKKEIENPDIIYQNARKIRLHPSYPEESFKAEAVFKNLQAKRGWNYYYARVFQKDGQMAWSSPVWVNRKLPKRGG